MIPRLRTIFWSMILSGVIGTPPVAADTPRQETLHLEEVWRAGGPEGEILFGTVTEATSDAEGNVYLLDTQLMHVEVFSPEGRHLRTLSRAGDGPGEVRRPRDVVYLPDGTLGLLELFPAKLVRLTPEGEPRPSIIIGGAAAQEGGFTAAGQCVSRGGTLLIAGQNLGQTPEGQTRDMYLARIAPTGEILLRYREARIRLDFAKLHFIEREMTPGFHLANTVGPDGRVYAALAWDRYAVEVFHPDGTLERVIAREFQNRPRTEDELRRVHALYDASAANTPYEVARTIEPSPAIIQHLHLDPAGNLWVLHSRSGEDLPTGVMQSYDVFTPAGVFDRQVQIACDGDPAYDGLEFLPDGRVLLIKGYVLATTARTDLGSVPLGEEEESSPMEILCCRLRG